MLRGTIPRMSRQVLIAGGGIGGLAAALACARAGQRVQVLERTARFAEIGAGIQIGPNVTRVLHGWGLADRLAEVAAYPQQLTVRNARSGRQLAVLRLGDVALRRYGAPYATVHRADLHRVLLVAVQEQPEVQLHADCDVADLAQDARGVAVRTVRDRQFKGDLLLGADGIWSTVRQWLLNDGLPRVTGHLAYRALVAQNSLPAHLRSPHITVWLGRDLHVVQYPVRGGEWLNLVGIVQGDGGLSADASGLVQDDMDGDPADWDQHTSAKRLRTALAATCAPLRDLVNAVDSWRRWVLCDRPPVRRADQLARGRVALLGDAAHPMRPYLAQGAGMAIEDAAALGEVLADTHQAVDSALRAYSEQRWRRNAQAQARALRNGQIFHAQGPLRVCRDAALSVFGERLLDLPWLYRHGSP